MIIMICSVFFAAFVFRFMCFYCFCSIVLSVFLLCYVVCCFTLANKPLIIASGYSKTNSSMSATNRCINNDEL